LLFLAIIEMVVRSLFYYFQAFVLENDSLYNLYCKKTSSNFRYLKRQWTSLKAMLLFV